MRRVLYTYGLIAGVIAGLVLAAGCTGRTEQNTVIPTSDLPAEVTEFARLATATIAALQTKQGGATATNWPTALPLTGTPESSGGSSQQVDHTSAQGEGGNASITPDPSPLSIGATSKAGVSYLEFDRAKTTSFSISSSNTTVPEDILQEINVFAGGGGGMAPGPCEERRGHPFIYIYEHDYEPLDEIFIGSCSWQTGEVVSVMLTRPDGVVISDTRDSLLYELTLDTPLGEYETVFRGESGEVRATVSVALPEGPRLHVRDDELLLYNFEPDENIRLLAYQKSPAILTAWLPFQTDPTGKLIIKLDSASMPDAYTYVVVGQQSGEVFPYSPIKKPIGDIGDTVLPAVAIERGGPFLTISGLSIRRPQAWNMEDDASLWTVAPSEALLAPGINAYDVRLTSRVNVLWRFSWCSRDAETRRVPLVLRFSVAGTEIPMYMFLQDEDLNTNPRASTCRSWTTLIEYWPEDAVSELAIEYDLVSEINDDGTRYPAGTYRNVIRVSLDQ